jgi:hypothetical protein
MIVPHVAARVQAASAQISFKLRSDGDKRPCADNLVFDRFLLSAGRADDEA